MQNQNFYQTTIRRQISGEEVTIILQGNRNSRYIRRTFILHPDGQTYDYIHEYDYKIPSPHYNKINREKWEKYNRILEQNLELEQNEDPDEKLEVILEGLFYRDLNAEPEVFDQIETYVNDHIDVYSGDLLRDVIQRFFPEYDLNTW